MPIINRTIDQNIASPPQKIVDAIYLKYYHIN